MSNDDREYEEGIARTLEVMQANIALNLEITALHVPQQWLLAQTAELIVNDAELEAAQSEAIEPFLDNVDAYEQLQRLQQELEQAQQRTRRTTTEQ